MGLQISPLGLKLENWGDHNWGGMYFPQKLKHNKNHWQTFSHPKVYGKSFRVILFFQNFFKNIAREKECLCINNLESFPLHWQTNSSQEMVNLVSYYKGSSLLNGSCEVLGRHNLPKKADESTIFWKVHTKDCIFYAAWGEPMWTPVRNRSMGNCITSPSPVMEWKYGTLLNLVCKALN